MKIYSYNTPPLLTVLGQCAFTYHFLHNLIKKGMCPNNVLIEADEVDSDPFDGLYTSVSLAWFSEHLLYYHNWKSAIKKLCGEHSITFIVGTNIIDAIPSSDILVIAGYAKKVPTSLLAKYYGWAINVHPSILPKFKGPQPEAQMILQDNYNYFGITLHEITDVWDSGHLYWQKTYTCTTFLTVGDMEKVEAELAAEGLQELLQNHPRIKPYEDKPLSSSSYFTWYDDSILNISSTQIEDNLTGDIFRLRPEGYAYIDMDNGRFYPIFEFFEKAGNEYLIDSLVGGVLKSDSSIEYFDRDQVIEKNIFKV